MRSEIRLAQVHMVIQIAMWWADSHLHQFRIIKFCGFVILSCEHIDFA
jgi:Plasmid pRiA4b ORF-3-like protein